MSFISITQNCSEFGRAFTTGQRVSDLSENEDFSMVASGLAQYSSAPPSPQPRFVLNHITSVMFATPALYGLHFVDERVHVFNGTRYVGNGIGLVAAGSGGGSGAAITGVADVPGLVAALALKRAVSTVVQTSASGVLPLLDAVSEIDTTLGPVTVQLPDTAPLGTHYTLRWKSGPTAPTVASTSVAKPIVSESGNLVPSVLFTVVGEVLTYYVSTDRFQRT